MLIFKKIKSDSKKIHRISESNMFDSEFYRVNYSLKIHVNTVKHYYSIGWKMGFNPSQFFNTEYYLKLYEDVRLKKINPLSHYLHDGGAELRRPSENFDAQSFCVFHPQFKNSRKTPAENCIALYGSYDWRLNSDLAQTIDERPSTFSAQITDGLNNMAFPQNIDDISNIVSAQMIDHLPKNYLKDVFDEGFYKSYNIDVARSGMDPFEHFIKFGQFESRDPSPDFDVSLYFKTFASKIASGKSMEEIYSENLKNGGILPHNPESIQIDPSLESAQSEPTAHADQLCVHAHCFYPELIRELIPAFHNLPSSASVVITVVSKADAQFVANSLKRHKIVQRFDVRIVPNIGRDIAPFLVGCRDIWHKFDVVLHLHTKVSSHISWGSEWRNYLFDQILGSKELVSSILKEFSTNEQLGCLYPKNYFKIREFVNWENNLDNIKIFMENLGFDKDSAVQTDYPAGSMAWYRTAALIKLIDFLTDLDRFEAEDGQVDLTFAHALERILPLVVRASGYEVRNYITPRRTRLVPAKGLPGRESSSTPIAQAWPRDTPRIARRPPRAASPTSRAYNPKALDVHWILPSFAHGGAGGHMTIFRMVEYLERFGHHQTLWLQNAVHFADQAQAKRRIQQWYRPIGSRVHVRFLPDDVRQISGDVLIATDCWTAYPAAQVTNVKERFYLIQDYEPTFHAVGDLHLIAEATYDFGFANLCAGNWLLDVMQARGTWARAWELCADHDVYYPGAPMPIMDRPVRIAFYARQYTPRRAVALGFAAFELMNKRGVKFQVDLFGEADLKFDYNFPFVQRGILTPAELGELYRSCDIGVVFSATNYSLIPLEMMACGLPVVEVDTESTRAIFKNDEVSFASPTPYSIADAIEGLISDPERQALQRERGFAFTNATSWEQSARALESGLIERLGEQGYTAVVPEELETPAIVQGTRATVFIPTYNGGHELARVLDSLSRQICDFPYDVLVVDSGSSDGTADRVRARGDRKIRVETISKTEFQHGRTRNLGIARSEGDYVAIITQDACPKDAHWLSALISGFARGSRVAGVTGRHEAYPEHDSFTRRDMEEMFDGLALLPDLLDRRIGLPSFIYPGGQGWGMQMRFYSDNNSAMSRAAWKVLPYPEIEWGEDQVWAEEALRLGFQKVYVDEAVVYHSHAFDLKQQYAVSTTEGRFWAEHFGIDLHPDPDNAIRAMNARDQAFALQKGISETVLQRRLLQNRATVQGRRAGYHLSFSMGR